MNPGKFYAVYTLLMVYCCNTNTTVLALIEPFWGPKRRAGRVKDDGTDDVSVSSDEPIDKKKRVESSEMEVDSKQEA